MDANPDKLVEIRSLRWPEDREYLLRLDTSFSTDRIFRLNHSDQSFSIEELQVSPRIRKTYSIKEAVDSLPLLGWTTVAVENNSIAGVIAVKLENWNRRAEIHHLYIAPQARRKGIGRMLIEAALQHARGCQMRSVLVETQTINYGAIKFYERLGFTLCGFDTSLYDPGDVLDGEIALFFERTII
ncbi:MAG TPA: GNAT family N-acetyltransferase [Blastocatellia bacterium]|nr:GNAT family N-acetyltransferase [Blastocatellia bacterium]